MTMMSQTEREMGRKALPNGERDSGEGEGWWLRVSWPQLNGPSGMTLSISEINGAAAAAASLVESSRRAGPCGEKLDTFRYLSQAKSARLSPV